MKTPVPESLFNKVAGLQFTTLLKKDSNIGVSREFCEIFKNIDFVDISEELLMNFVHHGNLSLLVSDEKKYSTNAKLILLYI